MPDETVIAPPKASSKTGLVRLVAIILTVLTVGAGAVVFIELPKMLHATQASALVKLMAQVNRTQQGLATEYNEVIMSGATKMLPDEARTNEIVKGLVDAVKGVDLDGLGLKNDSSGRQANLLLTDPNGQVAQARKTAYEGRVGDLVADFQSLIADGWTVQDAIVADLNGLNEQLAKQAAQFVSDCRELPVPIIDPTGQSPDPHQEIIAAIADPADRDANSAKLLGWGSLGLAAVLALAAIGLWVLSVIKTSKTKAAPDADIVADSTSSVDSKPAPTATSASAEPAASARVTAGSGPAAKGPAGPAKVTAPAIAKPITGSTPPRPLVAPAARPGGPAVPGLRPAKTAAGLRPPATPPSGPVDPARQGLIRPGGLAKAPGAPAAAGGPGVRPTTAPGLRPKVAGTPPVQPGGPGAPSSGQSKPPVAPVSSDGSAAAPASEAAKPAAPAVAKPRIPWRTTSAKEDQDKE